MDQHPKTAHSSVRVYLLVFLGLAILTGVTVLLSYLGLPKGLAVALAGLIALTKCSLIAAFFMHLRFETKTIHIIFFTGFVALAVLLLAIFPDIAQR